MQKGSVFWGGILILAGLLFMVGNLLHVSLWSLLGPALLIVFGLWVLVGATADRGALALESAAIPLGATNRARVRARFGAGRLTIGGGVAPHQLLEGTFSGGLRYQVRREGDLIDVDMQTRQKNIAFWPWTGGSQGMEWSFNLNDGIPLSFGLKTGGCEARLDLTALRLSSLRIQSGASSTHMILPANAGYTKVLIEAGAASVQVQVPAGVAASVRVRSGIVGIGVDVDRFPRVGSNVYRSPDYDTAQNKVEVTVEAGVGHVTVR